MALSLSLPAEKDAARAGRRARRRVALWLWSCAFMVFAMAVIGAITRLTESGLSMVEWRPLIGWLPPLSEAEWTRVFDLYRETPEYRHLNAGMGLEAFKEIFFWEWLHRLWGRAIGIVFALPLLGFWAFGTLGRITHVPRLGRKLLALLVLGGLQGVMGWVMVRSGLVDRPSVSHYRLAAHLGLAFLIFGALVWMALGVGRQERTPQPEAIRSVRRHAWATLAVLFLTVIWGAFVAGLDAGLAYNTWPLMGGTLLPPEAWGIEPLWLNPIQNTALVQFIHRWVAIIAALAVLALSWRALAARAEGAPRYLAVLAGLAVVAQVVLGITTLLTVVPVGIATLHQAGALVVFGLVTAFLAESRRISDRQI